ncbi:hypothetical protein K1719_046911 [Acacia pycnantha]|nr:hypothetical protein K1719_046911 [Acacia pycnantha]
MRRKKINELLSRCSKPNLDQELRGDYQTLLQRQTPSPKGSTGRDGSPNTGIRSHGSPNTGIRSRRFPNTGSGCKQDLKLNRGHPPPSQESSTPKASLKPKDSLPPSRRKNCDSYAKQPPNQIWEEVLAKKDNKTQALEHDRALALSLIASSSRAINKQEYDLANAKFALELTQKRPPQVPTPLLVTPANNPLGTPYIAKLAQSDILVARLCSWSSSSLLRAPQEQ